MENVSLKAVAATLLPFAGSVPGGIITKKNIKGWYEHLQRPSWRPPNWAFGPVWSCLYTGMGVASYLVYRDGGGFTGPAATPLVLYASQLALNWAWTPVFFGQHNVKGGLMILVALWANVAACGVSFYNINKTAGYLFLPYLSWVSLATALNYSVWKMNGDRPEPGKQA